MAPEDESNNTDGQLLHLNNILDKEQLHN